MILQLRLSSVEYIYMYCVATCWSEISMLRVETEEVTRGAGTIDYCMTLAWFWRSPSDVAAHSYSIMTRGWSSSSLQTVFDLLKLANKNNPILPQQNISEIHLSEKGELILYLLDRPFPIYLGTEGNISTRYYRLVKVLRDLYKTREFSKVSYIGLDYQKDTILVGKHDAQS